MSRGKLLKKLTERIVVAMRQIDRISRRENQMNNSLFHVFFFFFGTYTHYQRLRCEIENFGHQVFPSPPPGSDGWSFNKYDDCTPNATEYLLLSLCALPYNGTNMNTYVGHPLDIGSPHKMIIFIAINTSGRFMADLRRSAVKKKKNAVLNRGSDTSDSHREKKYAIKMYS